MVGESAARVVEDANLRQLFRIRLAARLHLKPEDLYGRDTTVSDVIALSPSAYNSIDIMEVFLATMIECGLEDDVELPAYTTGNTIDEVVAEIEAKLPAQA